MNDLIERASALAELEAIGQELSLLAEESLSISDSTYYSAKAKFDKDHPEYNSERGKRGGFYDV